MCKYGEFDDRCKLPNSDYETWKNRPEQYVAQEVCDCCNDLLCDGCRSPQSPGYCQACVDGAFEVFDRATLEKVGLLQD